MIPLLAAMASLRRHAVKIPLYEAFANVLPSASDNCISGPHTDCA